MRLKADIKTNGQSFSLVTLILLTFGQIPGKVEPDICPRERERKEELERKVSYSRTKMESPVSQENFQAESTNAILPSICLLPW